MSLSSCVVGFGAERPNKRLKLTGGDRFKGTGVLCPWRGTDFVPRPCACGRSRPQLKRDPLGCTRPSAMAQDPPMRTITPNIRWGLTWALWIATVFSAWVLALSLVRHAWRFKFDDLEMTAAQIVAGYYAAALIAGSVVGLLRPLLRWRIGTFVIGAIAGTLVYATIGLTMYGRNEALWVTPVLGLATGGLALVIQDEDRDRTVPNPRRVLLLTSIAVVLLIVLWFMYWR